MKRKSTKINPQSINWNTYTPRVVIESGRYIECCCGYEGSAEKVNTGYLKTGSVERCPKCRRPIQTAPKPVMKQDTFTLMDVT